MIGASRDSLAGLQESLQSFPPGDLSSLSGDLFSVAALLATEKSLRSVLSDSGVPAPARRAIVADVLGSRVAPSSLGTLEEVAAARWSEDADLVTALETLAVGAALLEAANGGELDRVEDELFRFGRAIESSPQLQLALTDPALTAERKAALVTDLVGNQASEVTTNLLAHTAGHLRGRAPVAAVAELSALAAAQRGRLLAVVRSVVALTDEQQRRLTAALDRITGRQVRLQIEVTPDVVGGIVVQVGDEVIDGSVATRLEQARRVLSA